MKRKTKLLLILIFVFICISYKVYGLITIKYSQNYECTIENITDNISKIELLYLNQSDPNNLFESETKTAYGYYYDENDIKRYVTSIDEYINLNAKPFDFSRTNIENLKTVDFTVYKINNYNQDKYYVQEDLISTSYKQSIYYNSNNIPFSFYEIEKQEAKENNIQNGKFKIVLQNIKTNYSQLIARFYTNNDYTDIVLNSNAFSTSETNYKITTIYRTFDYNTHKLLQEDKISFNKIIDAFLLIIMIFILPLIIKLLIAKVMKIQNKKIIIKANILTQIFFNIIYLIPRAFYGHSLVGLLNNIFLLSVFSILVIPIIIIITEYLLYQKEIENKKDLLMFSLIANILSYISSSIIYFVLSNRIL